MSRFVRKKLVWCEDCDLVVILHLPNADAWCVCGKQMVETGELETR